MNLEEIEALDLKPGQRIELTLNTTIDPDKRPLPDNELYTKMVYYDGLTTSEHGTCFLKYLESPQGHLDINGALGRTPAVEGRKMLPLIRKISHLEVV